MLDIGYWKKRNIFNWWLLLWTNNKQQNYINKNNNVNEIVCIVSVEMLLSGVVELRTNAYKKIVGITCVAGVLSTFIEKQQ